MTEKLMEASFIEGYINLNALFELPYDIMEI